MGGGPFREKDLGGKNQKRVAARHKNLPENRLKNAVSGLKGGFMSALTLRFPRTGHNLSKPQKKSTGEDACIHAISSQLSRIIWFTLAFLLSCAAGPFAAIGVLAAVFSLANIDSEEPMPKEA